jgi:YebC/PmpR family DNA-binding regulatory protein
MSGHSHWATIRRKKGAGDAKRGQMYTRLAREIAMATRESGSDADSNFRLRIAIEKARAQNMPKESIDRAIKRGSGESKEGTYEELMYEGYAPKGIALVVQCVTENRNRTVAELRHVLSRTGGNLGEAGSVAWQFTRHSYFSFSAEGKDFDKVFEIAVENGADDVTNEDGMIEIIAPVESFKLVSVALNKAKITPEEAELRMIPNAEIELSVDETLSVLRAIEQVEDLDDVQSVFHNMAISEEAMTAMEAE